MDKLDYVLIALAAAIQLFTSAAILYLNGRAAPEPAYSIAELAARSTKMDASSVASDVAEQNRTINLAGGALLGMGQQIERLRKILFNQAVLGLIVVFFTMIVIVRLHLRIRRHAVTRMQRLP